MSRFSFAHLLGRGPSQDAPPGTPPANPPGQQGQIPPTLNMPPAGGNAPPAPGQIDPAAAAAAAQQAAIDQAVAAAVGAARTEAAAAERQRCGEILSAPEAAGNLVMACHLAFETDLSAQAAISALRAVPAPAPKGNPNALLQQDQAPQPKIGGAVDGGGQDDAATSAAIINTMRSFGMHPAGPVKEG